MVLCKYNTAQRRKEKRAAHEHGHISRGFPGSADHSVLNRYCDTFIVGSDVVWNYEICDKGAGQTGAVRDKPHPRPESRKVQTSDEDHTALGIGRVSLPDPGNAPEKGRSSEETVPVEEWLYAFRETECYVGDSFHGMCFAIIMKIQSA
ncbi:MAG: polysaccharide pyruvyl transferase family protein [Oscillospiraceae bacterium]|nr:polysaccharide pyruvyl transferase family protein [Oscillospiraceae bacterium]